MQATQSKVRLYTDTREVLSGEADVQGDACASERILRLGEIASIRARKGQSSVDGADQRGVSPEQQYLWLP